MPFRRKNEPKMSHIPVKLIHIRICAFIAVFWAAAAWSAEIYIPPVHGESGGAVDVPIMIDHVENLAGVKLVMTYDPKILAFKTGNKTRHTDSLMHIINDKRPGRLIIVMAGARGIGGKNFCILRLTFVIKKGLSKNHATRILIKEVQLMSDKLKDIRCTTRSTPLTISPFVGKAQKN